MKDLARLKLQPTLLEYLLLYWVEEGGGGNFKLGAYMAPFSIEDAAKIIGLPNKETVTSVENRKPSLKMCHFKGVKIN